MLTTLTTGKENFTGSSAAVYAFFLPNSRFQGTETLLGMLSKGERFGVRQVGFPQTIPAGRNLKPEIVGKWVTSTLDLPEGMVVKLHARRSINGITSEAAMLIQVRQSAPLIRLSSTLTNNALANMSAVTMEGRFDILTPVLAAQEGVAISDLTLRQLRSGERSALITVARLAGETEARTTIQRVRTVNSEGAVVEVATPKKKRMIDV